MDEIKTQILNAIKKYNKIIIHRHVRPDPDAYGSQGGLAEILRTSFPEKKIYKVGKDEKTLEYLFHLDQIPDEEFKDALVIVTDTANAERICDQRYKLGKMLIKIDHHPNDEPFGDIVWVDTNASSCSEMIFELFQFGKEQGLKLSNEGARLLFAGIVADTGRFLFPSTTEKTFEIASELIKYDFSRSKLYDQMYEIPLNVVKLQGYILNHFQMSEKGVAYISLNKEILKQYDARPADASLLVNAIRDVAGVVAWVFFIEEDEQIRVRLRSKGPVINGVAKKYGGGGHPLAAGATIYSWDEVDDVLKDLNELL